LSLDFGFGLGHVIRTFC